MLGTEASTGTTVDLPHCWNCNDTFQDGTEYYRGPGCYRRTFDVSPECLHAPETTWRIEIERFYGTGELWVNGTRSSNIDGQYLGVSIDITPALRVGRNVVAVSLTNRCGPDVLPGTDSPDFVLYGGLAGRATLRARSTLHIIPGTVRIDCSDPRAAHIECQVGNDSDRDRAACMRWELRDVSGTVLGMTAQPASMPPNGQTTVCAECSLEAPLEPWSPDGPVLYRATGTLLQDDHSLDTVDIQFGSRSIEFGPHGFFLNGERLELRGANRHESMPGFGNAIPRELHYHDARLLKEAGFNFVRLSHYPQHPHFLDACDEMGILVYAELASWKSVRTGRWLENACRQMEQLVRRDRNRPSVILWGLGNEERVRGAYERLDALVKELDPSRSTIYAENHLHRAKRRKTTGLTDVWGCNYELNLLADLGQHARSGAVVVSEAACYPLAERGDLEQERFQIEMLEQDLEKLDGMAHVTGVAVWSLLDYATSRKGRYRFLSGLVDAWRVPKASYYYMQARNLGTTCLRLFGDWSECTESPTREILVITNCARVVLECEGTEIAALSGGCAMVASLEFSPCVLTAYGERESERIRADLPSWGPAHRLRLVAEDALPSGETAIYRVEVVDAKDIACQNWHGAVHVRSPGDARVMTPTLDNTISVRSGVGRIFVRSARPGSESIIRVDAPGLEPGEMIVRL